MSSPERAAPALYAVLALAAQLAGCRDEASSDAGATAGAAATASAVSSAAVDYPKLADDAPAEGVVRWTDFPGEKVEVTLSGPRQWAAVPVSGSWDSVTLALLAYDGPREHEHAFDGGKVLVPGAFVHPAASGDPPELAVGTPVWVSLYGTTAPGRVRSAPSEGKVEVDVEWIDEVTARTVSQDELLPLTGALTFGAPVAYDDDGVRRAGTLVHRGATTSWVIAWGGKPTPVPSASLSPVSVDRVFAKGDAVLATHVGRFTDAVVTAVEANGLRYVVDPAEGDPETLAFTEITAPPR